MLCPNCHISEPGFDEVSGGAFCVLSGLKCLSGLLLLGGSLKPRGGGADHCLLLAAFLKTPQ